MTKPLITIRQAQELVLEAIVGLGPEPVEIADALDRVLAEDIAAAGDVPPFACSAMDGYAVIAGPAGRTLEVLAESRAGAPTEHRVKEGQAVRISTGAAVPPGANAVVRQEDTVHTGETVAINVDVSAGANIRDAGEDMRAGALVLQAGSVLGAAEIGAAVAAGAGTAAVTRRPRLAVLATGDELRAAGEPLGPGQIHNSNGPMLTALAIHSGAAASPPRRLPDDAGATEAGLAAALERAEVVIVSGGVSVGPHDHVKPALQRLGVRERFWGVALQPGKPTWFGTRGHQLVFGLPGNPVSAVVTFSLFADRAIAAMLGRPPAVPPDTSAILDTSVPSNRNREQALRVRLSRRDGAVVATPNGPQGSHIMTSLLHADALALIPPGDSALPAGARVELAHLAG